MHHGSGRAVCIRPRTVIFCNAMRRPAAMLVGLPLPPGSWRGGSCVVLPSLKGVRAGSGAPRCRGSGVRLPVRGVRAGVCRRTGASERQSASVPGYEIL